VSAVALLPTLAERLAPGNAALLVIDMQNDFCAEEGYIEKAVGRDASACRAIAARVMTLVDAARAASVPVLWVCANYAPEFVAPHFLLKQRERAIETVCCAPESWGAAFYGVSARPDEPVVEKHTYSAFVKTALDGLLRARGVRSLIFTGVQTNVCVESSVRDAAALGYHIVVAEDAVASHTRELHDATLANVRIFFGDVVPAQTIAQAWRS
jgi:ureidoacrylate peracid hydrolase